MQPTLPPQPSYQRTEQTYQPPQSTSTSTRRLLPDLTASSAPALGYPHFPHNPNNVFDNILPRGLLYLLIDHFFDYIYPLNPIIHRPTFLRDVLVHREEKPGETEWIAMVMTVVALTIIQLPPSFLPISIEEARRITMTCYRHARGAQLAEYHQLSLCRRELLS